MKKQTFAILFCALLTGCAFIESSPIYGSEAVRTAELDQEPKAKEPKKLDIDYIISLNGDSIKVIDPKTGIIVLNERYDSGSTLAEAMLNDNL